MMMKKVGSQLNTIGQQYQVDPATLVAIFGIETNTAARSARPMC